MVQRQRADSITQRQRADSMVQRQRADSITQRQRADSIVQRQRADSIVQRQRADSIVQRQRGTPSRSVSERPPAAPPHHGCSASTKVPQYRCDSMPYVLCKSHLWQYADQVR